MSDSFVTMDCSLPGSSVHGILQVRILEWVAMPFFNRSSNGRDRPQVFHIACRFFTVWATREAFLCIRPFSYSSSICWKNCSFSFELSLHLCWKSIDKKCKGRLSGLSSIDLYVYFYVSTRLIIVAKALKLGNGSFPTLFFFKIVLIILSFLHFHRNYRISLSISIKRQLGFW